MLHLPVFTLTLFFQKKASFIFFSFGKAFQQKTHGTHPIFFFKVLNTAFNTKKSHTPPNHPTPPKKTHNNQSKKNTRLEEEAPAAVAPSAPSAPPSKDADFRRAAFEEAQQLTSVEELRQAVELAGDEILSKLLKQSVYVGPVNHECLGFCRMIEDQTFPDVFFVCEGYDCI